MDGSSCVFCRIARREEPAAVVYESETVIAFRDINPQAPVHVQVIPKEHLTSALEIEERHADVLADLFQAARQIARAEGVASAGFRLVTNVGREGGQHVFHLHVHLLGGRPMGWPPG
ncbi:MAG TPA: histidine triad nucleotide-binding protein [Actinomycetota bacterium]|nr:histidine triad nucleotide-binding protein [Actinomycetota bacterium]